VGDGLLFVSGVAAFVKGLESLKPLLSRRCGSWEKTQSILVLSWSFGQASHWGLKCENKWSWWDRYDQLPQYVKSRLRLWYHTSINTTKVTNSVLLDQLSNTTARNRERLITHCAREYWSIMKDSFFWLSTLRRQVVPSHNWLAFACTLCTCKG